MAEIIINIKPNGETDIKVEGWQGESCSLKSAPYRDALGRTVSDIPTAEAFETNTQQLEAVQ